MLPNVPVNQFHSFCFGCKVCLSVCAYDNLTTEEIFLLINVSNLRNEQHLKTAENEKCPFGYGPCIFRSNYTLNSSKRSSVTDMTKRWIIMHLDLSKYKEKTKKRRFFFSKFWLCNEWPWNFRNWFTSNENLILFYLIWFALLCVPPIAIESNWVQWNQSRLMKNRNKMNNDTYLFNGNSIGWRVSISGFISCWTNEIRSTESTTTTAAPTTTKKNNLAC